MSSIGIEIGKEVIAINRPEFLMEIDIHIALGKSRLNRSGGGLRCRGNGFGTPGYLSLLLA
jgi:hypothetical protein